MTREKLKQYLAYKREISSLEQSIEKLRKEADKVRTVSGKVQSSQKEFPYIEEHVTVQMKDPRLNDAIERRIAIREKRLREAEAAALEIEQYIAEMDDSTDRQIFEHVYLEGLTQKATGELLGFSQEGIADRIRRRLDENSGKSG